jgi:RNA polymerase sigma-70 factor (ECF subfamily)
LTVLETPDDALEDDAAFGRDLVAMAPNMRAFAISLSRSRGEGDDIAQAALLKAWRSRASFQRGTNLKAWLFTIIRNEFYSLARKGRHVGEMSEMQWDRLEAPPSPAPALFELDALRRGLAALPIEQREAVVLIGAGGLTYDQVAAMTGHPIGTIKSRLSRGRAALAAALENISLPRDDRHASEALDLLLAEVEERRRHLDARQSRDAREGDPHFA